MRGQRRGDPIPVAHQENLAIPFKTPKGLYGSFDFMEGGRIGPHGIKSDAQGIRPV
jgi:hypothetical protein